MAEKSRLALVGESPKPSSSTVAGALLGTPAAIVLVWLINVFAHVDVPGEVGAAIGSILGAVLGYVFPGGISADTK